MDEEEGEIAESPPEKIAMSRDNLNRDQHLERNRERENNYREDMNNPTFQRRISNGIEEIKYFDIFFIVMN